MKFTVMDCEQRSIEWYAARAGRLTGSVAGAMMTKIKSGEAAARRDLRLSLALARITGIPEESDYVSKEMQRGIDLEPVALGEYEIATGVIVQRTGFLSCDGIMAGCSLDGHINNFEGIVEYKCPKSATHYKYLRDGVLPSEHRQQCMHNLWVSGAKWCDFVSFDDRFPEHLQLFIVRMERDESAIKEYEAEAMRFLAEVAIDVKEISELRKAA